MGTGRTAGRDEGVGVAKGRKPGRAGGGVAAARPEEELLTAGMPIAVKVICARPFSPELGRLSSLT